MIPVIYRGPIPNSTKRRLLVFKSTPDVCFGRFAAGRQIIKLRTESKAVRMRAMTEISINTVCPGGMMDGKVKSTDCG